MQKRLAQSSVDFASSWMATGQNGAHGKLVVSRVKMERRHVRAAVLTRPRAMEDSTAVDQPFKLKYALCRAVQ
ncbi:hypothetical protein DPMN_176900 [Dreissena polymorpha]|uniref:Uncharacterized protein n=1 Tax=Dreissena polymorpha TaxID=45954 RepID=A0A9D4E7R9_DREPO|nr:hypothetical protein DPMN_176900 [Dreissena polymorpha]